MPALNRRFHLLPLSLACGMLFAASPALAQPAAAAPAEPVAPAPSPARAGTLKQIEGTVWVAQGATGRQAVTPGDGLTEAQRLQTGADGAASVVLRDGTVLAIGPNSTIEINEFAFDATTQQGNVLLDLLQGSVRVITGILAKVNPEVFKVRTPTSVVGVRGTDFIVDTEAAR